MAVDEVRVCYPLGFFGWALVYTALGAPRLLWAGLAWYGVRCAELYFLVLWASSAVAFALQYTAAAYLFDQPAVTALSCNNNVRAAPDLTVLLALQYTVVAEVHDRWVGAPWSWWVFARRVLFAAVAVPVVLVLTENTTWAHAAEGAGFGVATGGVVAAAIYVVLVPRLHEVCVPRYVGWVGLREHRYPAGKAVV